ncbi:hypothetical protein N0V83_002464 [Neocucurbitaria cava]|uniref:Mcm2 3 5 family protein n=1 Tax=Neocucurbitaria cava TaxID=798079 RepID=A0A9W8YFA2_9PLEO|nr:hypothetical protein N0V83_002464 [Neocucurbitaria cava]
MDCHGSADHHTHTETNSTLAAPEFEDEFDQIGTSLEQRHDGDSQTPRLKAREADTTTPDALSSVPPYKYVTQSGTNCVHRGNSGHDRPQHERPLFDTTGGFDPGKECPTRRGFHTSRFTWMHAAIVFICSVSTVLAALFVTLALKGQRYGNWIGNEFDSKMTISTAILWTSVLAKTIELTFVTAFVTFLGQVISRKAFMQSSGHGVTLSEMTMWRWVVQPGTLFTQSQVARYAGFSILGVLTLLCTVLSTLYVTAATALVQPIPKESKWHSKVMTGSVSTDFASLKHIQDTCKLPIAPGIDDTYLSTTCMQISHAARSMYNEQTFLATWSGFLESGNDTSNQEQRPAVVGLQYGNSTVVPQWINIINTTEVSNLHQRVVNNVTLALPHIGVVDAIHNQRNRMPQSESSNSIGPYSLWASVPSPMINVFCVHMTETELEPIVFSSWPQNDTFNADDWFTSGNFTTWKTLVTSHVMDLATTRNKTVVDDIFEWYKEDTETMLDYPPVFPLFPKPFNTVLNHTSFSWGRSAIYVLGQGADPDDSYKGPDLKGQYPLCRIKAGITPDCSTIYSTSVAGSKVEVLCGDRAGEMAYVKTNTSATTIPGHPNWRDLGADWASSLSLDTGINDGYASNNRLLMQLLLTPEDKDLVNLDPKLPSLAEVLASLASDTLVLATKDAPFVEYFNYTLPPHSSSLKDPEPQWFQAKIRSQEYASGGVDSATKGWLVVLISTFVINTLMLVYFILQPGLVTDFSQPPQLFALAINSPPARVLAGSCGTGPEGKQYKVGWVIDQEGEHLFMQPYPDENSALPRNEYDSGSFQVSNAKAGKGSGVLASLSPTLSRAKHSLRSRARPSAKSSPATSTELLRSPSRNESTPSLQPQYELEEFEPRRQYSRLGQGNNVF